MDKIITSTAIDSVASRVVSKGISYIPNKNIDCFHSEIMPELREKTKCEKNNRQFIDLTGISFGRLIVIGLPKNKNIRGWVVRCSCGCFENRLAVTIKKKHKNNMCSNCQHLEFLKQHNKWKENINNVRIT